MKTFALALAAMGIAAGAAQADAYLDSMTNNHNGPVFAGGVHATVEVPAGAVLSPKELNSENLSASDSVSVTYFPSTGAVDGPSRS